MKTHEIAELVGGELRGDGEIEITSAAGLNSAGAEQVTFIEKDTGDLRTAAACLIVPPNFDAAYMSQSTLISVKNPRLAFALVAGRLHPPKFRKPEVHSTAFVSKSASIGSNVFIGAFVSVGENSTVGDGTHLRAGSKIGDD